MFAHYAGQDQQRNGSAKLLEQIELGLRNSLQSALLAARGLALAR